MSEAMISMFKTGTHCATVKATLLPLAIVKKIKGTILLAIVCLDSI